MRKLFARQLAKARREDGEVDLVALGELVVSAYEEAELDRRRTDRSIALMVEELSEGHQQLADAFEVVPEGIALFDAEDRLVRWNRRYAEAYAETGEAIAVGMRFEDMLRAGLARAQYAEAVGREEEWLAARLARHRQPSSTHEQHLANDRWIRVEERRTADGGSIGVRIDITELKQREASFRLLFESNPVPMFVCDAHLLALLAVNDAAVAHYGYSRDALLHMTVYDLRVPEDRDGARQLAQSGQGNRQSGQIRRHLKADGTRVDVSIYSMPLEYQGRPATLFAAIDVTKRMLAESRLSEQKRLTDTAINNMSQGLLMFDADARLLLFNQRYLELYGLSPEVVRTGCSLFELIEHRRRLSVFAGDPQKYCEDIIASMAQGKIITHTIELPDGRTIQSVSHPMAGGGWVATHEDVTERRRLLRAQEQAEQVVQEQRLLLDTALNNMVHGLCMFDAEGRIRLFNARYTQMMGLSADDLMGQFLLDLFRKRKATGQFTGDPEQFFADVLAAAREGRSTTNVTESKDGRALRIVHHPMPNGGWVATFEDITEQRKIEKERDQDRMFLNQIVDNVPVMIVVKDARTRRFVLVNRAAEALWGVSRSEALGKSARELFSQAQAEIIDVYDDEALQSDTPLVLEPHPNMARSGDQRTVTSKRLAIRDKNGAPQFLVSVVEDVTERRIIEQERDRNREFLDQIIDNVPTTIIVKDALNRRYVLINRAAEAYFGASREQIIGKTVYDIYPADEAEAVTKRDDLSLQSEGHPLVGEHSVETLGIGRRFVTDKRITITADNGEAQYLINVVDDITERKWANERIAYQAHHDALTDLPNRILFREHLEQSLKRVNRGEQLAVHYLDLDQFKSVNDTLGHPVGDDLLKAVAIRLRTCLKETDIVARLGGDEFAIIQTPITGPMDATDLANRILDAIRRPFEVGSHHLVADSSIGIAVAPDDGIDPDQLLKNADLAMYGAKTDGRGTYRFFEHEMDARVKARRALEFDLREAIMSGGFELYYQPLTSLQDDRITGCEALMRWRHPTRGMISPLEFIPIAEESGLINHLGAWALRTACTEAMTWPDEVKVAVNISPVQFKSGNLVQTIVSALASSRLPPRRLEMEITEAVLIRDDDRVLAILHQLRELGVRIAMDDFGTGYSSLSYLQRFPFDKIKIDRIFIKDLAETNGSFSIVQAVVGIAAARNISTTAEGVETEQQKQVLRKLGCTEMQGYLFSPPRSSADIAQLLIEVRGTTAAVA